MPSPPKLIVRIIAIGAIVLWLAYSFEREIVGVMIPVFQDVMMVTQSDFRILSIKIVGDETNEVLRLRANLAHPVAVAGHVANPIDGWFEVKLTLGGVLGYGLIALIVVLAWPFVRVKELLVRIAVALPLIAALLIVNVIFTWRAELWVPLLNDFDPHGFSPLLIWSRFLMGGGGYIIGLLCAIAAIHFGTRLTAPRKNHASNHARFIVSTTALADTKEHKSIRSRNS